MARGVTAAHGVPKTDGVAAAHVAATYEVPTRPQPVGCVGPAARRTPATARTTGPPAAREAASTLEFFRGGAG